MTSAQQVYLLIDLPAKNGRPARTSLWTAACRAQQWNKSDRTFRLEILSKALGRQIASATEIGALDDFDAVKRHLLMLADNVAGARETIEPEMGRARRLRDAIGDLIKCIRVYLDDQTDPFVAQIIKDKFNHGSRVTVVTVDDLTAAPIILRNGRQIPSQLDQLVYTLGACLNGSGKIRGGKRSRLGFRVAAGDTLHEMKIKAGVKCDCAQCLGGVSVPASRLDYQTETVKEPDPF